MSVLEGVFASVVFYLQLLGAVLFWYFILPHILILIRIVLTRAIDNLQAPLCAHRCLLLQEGYPATAAPYSHQVSHATLPHPWSTKEDYAHRETQRLLQEPSAPSLYYS